MILSWPIYGQNVHYIWYFESLCFYFVYNDNTITINVVSCVLLCFITIFLRIPALSEMFYISIIFTRKYCLRYTTLSSGFWYQVYSKHMRRNMLLCSIVTFLWNSAWWNNFDKRSVSRSISILSSRLKYKGITQDTSILYLDNDHLIWQNFPINLIIQNNARQVSFYVSQCK